jgi:dCMP deaminase
LTTNSKRDQKKRPTADETFLEICDVVRKRSTCLRRAVGAVLVKDGQVLATGYNGAPRGSPHCIELGTCLREELNVPSGERAELCRGVHAEQNVIIQAARHGVNIKGSTLYCTNFPCSICSKMIINAGIIKIVYRDHYTDELSLKLLQEADIELVQYESTTDSEERESP